MRFFYPVAKSNPTHSQAGQIGVIILLIMVVLLTTGLSLAVRTTQELFLSQQTAETTRVFNAAEAGIEEALSSQLDVDKDNPENQVVSGSINTISDTTVNYQITKVQRLETKLFEGVTVMADVAGVTTGQSVQLDWSKEDNCSTQDPASLLISIYSGDATSTQVRHVAVGACDRSDGFEVASSINVDGYRRRYSLPLATNDLFLRIKPLYNDTDIRVTGTGWTMPVQYFNIRSEAQNERGNESRIVEVNRTLPAAPSIMDYAVYSGTTVNK